MEEKTIIKGELKRANLVWVSMILPVLGIIVTLIYKYWAAYQEYFYWERYSRHYGYGMKTFSYCLASVFSGGDGADFVLYPLILILCIIGFIIYKRMSKVQITITDKRVYGTDVASKRVDLPLDSISAVRTSSFSGLAVSTASGSLKFTMLKNRDELHETISNLLVLRQDKVVSATIKPEIPQSNADELKKYKDLLDSGIITQDEFDAKKKQLLGL